jgi:transposase-like protein
MKKFRIAPEVKAQIINRIKNEGVSVAQAAKDAGVSDVSVYSWLGKKVEGGPTVLEMVKQKKEIAMLYQLVGELTLKLSESQKKK